MGLEAVTLFGMGTVKADHCVIAVEHRPTPGRYVWHHVLPQACGGKTELANLIQVCDNCHYSIHGLMWRLAQNGIVGRHRGAYLSQLVYAMQGYRAAVEAGTEGRIPKES